MNSDIRRTVLQSIEEACRQADLEVVPTLESRLGDLGLDSLRLVEIIYELEQRFAIEMDEERLAQLATVADVVTMAEEACHGSDR